MQEFETYYVTLVNKVLNYGEPMTGRNGNTLCLFGEQFSFGVRLDAFPILQGRKIYYKGVIGELAAFFSNCDSVEEFEALGCNYWKTWADENGHLEVDYAKQLHDFNGVNQLQMLIDGLINEPESRRHVISLWRPDRLDKLSLPCCHYAYQFHVDSQGALNMIWIQRSVDVMVGLPSDMILASLWLALIARRCGYDLGRVTMQLGNVHIYGEHFEKAEEYTTNAILKTTGLSPARLIIKGNPLGLFNAFNPNDLEVVNYEHLPPIKFELKA